MNLEQKLTEVFATNFQAYYRSHAAHVNVVGRNFVNDHAILSQVYEDLQGNIDVLGELLRTIRAFMPGDLTSIIGLSATNDATVEGDATDFLRIVYADQEVLIDLYKELMEAADLEGAVDISNYAQDRVGVHQKNAWMLRSILDA